MWNSWVDEVCSARDFWSDECQVLKAGKVRSWSFDRLLSDVDGEGGQVTGITVLHCVFKGSLKGIVKVDAIFVLICLPAEEGKSDVGAGARCNDVESRYGLGLSIDFMRNLLYCSLVMPSSIYGSW